MLERRKRVRWGKVRCNEQSVPCRFPVVTFKNREGECIFEKLGGQRLHRIKNIPSEEQGKFVGLFFLSNSGKILQKTKWGVVL